MPTMNVGNETRALRQRIAKLERLNNTLIDCIREARAPLGNGKCEANKCEGCLVETAIAIKALDAGLKAARAK